MCLLEPLYCMHAADRHRMLQLLRGRQKRGVAAESSPLAEVASCKVRAPLALARAEHASLRVHRACAALPASRGRGREPRARGLEAERPGLGAYARTVRSCRRRSAASSPPPRWFCMPAWAKGAGSCRGWTRTTARSGSPGSMETAVPTSSAAESAATLTKATPKQASRLRGRSHTTQKLATRALQRRTLTRWTNHAQSGPKGASRLIRSVPL